MVETFDSFPVISIFIVSKTEWLLEPAEIFIYRVYLIDMPIEKVTIHQHPFLAM